MTETELERKLDNEKVAINAIRDELSLALDARDSLILEAIETGMSYRKIAKIVDLSPEQIRHLKNGNRHGTPG